jgi:hypothetical protein
MKFLEWLSPFRSVRALTAFVLLGLVAAHAQNAFAITLVLPGGERLHPGYMYAVKCSALDASGQVLTGYTGHVHFTSTDADPRVSLPRDYQFTAADAGVHTFQFALYTGGVQTLTVTDDTGLSSSIRVVVDFLGPPTDFAVGQGPHPLPLAVAAADVNGDGIPDLVSVNPGDGTISVLLGNGDGTFQSALTFLDVAAGPGHPWPWALAVADVNGDGIPDLIVGDADSSSLTIWSGVGNGLFINPEEVDGCPGCPGPSKPSLTTVEVNGVVNIVMTHFGGNVVSVLAGDGHGRFHAPQLYPVGQGPTSVAAGDFNRDGVPDLVVTNYSSGSLSVLLGNRDGAYQPGATFGPSPWPWAVAVVDVNRDGILDLLVAEANAPNPTGTTPPNHLWTLLGQGDGTFVLDPGDDPPLCPPWSNVPFPWPPPPSPIVVGDFNGDGIVDVALPDYGNNAVWVSLGNGRGGFQRGLLYGAGAGPLGLAAADFNRDGLLDLAVSNSGSNTVSILLNQSVPRTTP